MTQINENLNAKLTNALFNKLDCDDGTKDGKISGSIWNKYFNSEAPDKKVDDNCTLTIAEAMTNINEYVSSLSEAAVASLYDLLSSYDTHEEISYDEDKKTKFVDEYDAKNIMIKRSAYNEDGQPEYIMEFDKAGNLIRKTDFENGFIIVQDLNPDGTSVVNLYDQDNNKLCTEFFNGNSLIKAERYYPDGTLLQKDIYENDKISEETYYRPNGTTDYKITSEDGFNVTIFYDELGNITNKKSTKPDGIVGKSVQFVQGDCYLMASINAIMEATGGQEYLSSLIQQDGDNYIVTLPGAKIAANSLLDNSKINPDKMYITGIYTFTKSDLLEIIKHSGGRYSYGDSDTILIEAAFERYREEVYKTMTENNLKQNNIQAGLNTGSNIDDILDGGYTHDAIFVLTGEKSEVYYKIFKKSIDFGAFETTDSWPGNHSKNSNNNFVTANDVNTDSKDGNETSNTSCRKRTLRKMLDKIANTPSNEKDYIATCGMRAKQGEAHAFTIIAVTDDCVILEDPTRVNQPPYIMNIDTFISKVNTVSLAFLPKKTN